MYWIYIFINCFIIFEFMYLLFLNSYMHLLFLTIKFFLCFYLLQEPTDIPSRKKLMRWVCARGLVCQKREFTVRSSSCEVMIRS